MGGNSGEKAGDYISLRLDDPSFGQPIRSTSFAIGRNRTVDCTHVQLPISPGWNCHMIGIRATR